jgi:putative membrane protein
MTIVLVVLAAFALEPLAASAHTVDLAHPNQIWSIWIWDPSILIPLGFTLYLYVRGLVRLWRRAGWGRGITYARAACFVAGITTLFIALVSPIDALADDLLSAHMVQHLILIMIAAPLLVLSKPLVPILWALPREWRRSLTRGWAAWSSTHGWWSVVTRPAVTGGLFSLVFLTWHIPPLYQAALRSDAIHATEHASFLGISLLFWWDVIQPYGRHQRSIGGPIALLALGMFEGSVLGALMTFSNTLWYPAYSSVTRVWGLSPLEDQQLAGLIMWIPAGTIYICVALGLLGSWFHQADREEEGLSYPLIAHHASTPE